MVIGNTVIKHKHPIDMHWSCRRRTPNYNTWQQTWYFNVDFDSNGLLIIINLKNKRSTIKNSNDQQNINFIL